MNIKGNKLLTRLLAVLLLVLTLLPAAASGETAASDKLFSAIDQDGYAYATLLQPTDERTVYIYGDPSLSEESLLGENKVSVDLISTSEANISVTVDASEKIDKVVEEISEFAEVFVDDDKSQVSVIGKNIVRLNGMLKKTFAPLKRCNVYMISQGASFVNISFVVDREELTDVVKDLHHHLFEQPEELETF